MFETHPEPHLSLIRSYRSLRHPACDCDTEPMKLIVRMLSSCAIACPSPFNPYSPWHITQGRPSTYLVQPRCSLVINIYPKHLAPVKQTAPTSILPDPALYSSQRSTSIVRTSHREDILLVPLSTRLPESASSRGLCRHRGYRALLESWYGVFLQALAVVGEPSIYPSFDVTQTSLSLFSNSIT